MTSQSSRRASVAATVVLPTLELPPTSNTWDGMLVQILAITRGGIKPHRSQQQVWAAGASAVGPFLATFGNRYSGVMNVQSRWLVGPALFILGCATGGAASRYVGTANAAPPPEGTPRWSYTCFKSDNVRRIQDEANRAGDAGWELAASALSGGSDMSSPIWCFKRPR